MHALTDQPVLVPAPVRGDARAVRVPHGACAVPVARREFMADVGPRFDGQDVVHEAAVVVSELLGNAVRHAHPLPEGGVLLRWQVRGDVVDVEVTDGGGSSPVVPARPSAFATHGRGLRIVRSLAHEWGVVEDAEGHRTVWAALGGASRRRHLG
jgi:two-component sensor histidine kinase